MTQKLMRTVYVIEHRQRDFYAVHKIVIGCPGPLQDYLSLKSFNAFARRMRRHVSDHIEKHGYVGMPRRFDVFHSQADFDTELEVWDRLGGWARNEMRNAPQHEHVSIWDFYKYLGYDHRKDKFYG